MAPPSDNAADGLWEPKIILIQSNFEEMCDIDVLSLVLSSESQKLTDKVIGAISSLRYTVCLKFFATYSSLDAADNEQYFRCVLHKMPYKTSVQERTAVAAASVRVKLFSALSRL